MTTSIHQLNNQYNTALSKTCQDAGTMPGQYNRQRHRDIRSLQMRGSDDAVLSHAIKFCELH